VNRRVLVLLIVLALLSVTVIFHATSAVFRAWGNNLVRNGSFETGNFVNDPAEPIMDGSECKALCGGSSALSDWQVFRGPVSGGQSCANEKDAICWFQSNNTLNIDAQDGQRAVDLTGFNGRPPQQFGSVQQDVGNTQPAELYELSFEIGSSSNFAPPTPNPQIGILVKVVGVQNAQASFDVTIPITDVSHWEQHSMRFRAVDRTTTIIFSGIGKAPPNGNGGDYVGLDNVSLRKVCSLFDFLWSGCQ
jgi:hypothetical protein